MCSNIFLLLILILNIFFSDEKDSVYHVVKLQQPVEIDSEWNKEPWNNISALHITNYMGEEPVFKPKVQAKIAYDSQAIYVIFKVEDKFVRCAVDEYQGPVYRDSCVEFFFTPGTDISNGYFNLEVNCGGTALFAYQEMRSVGRIKIPQSSFKKIDLAHSLPTIVMPERKDLVTWTIEYRIPIDILTDYTNVVPPASGVEWKANLYKIASTTSNPHYLTWSYVDHPKPQFHLPEYFGTLKFQ